MELAELQGWLGAHLDLSRAALASTAAQVALILAAWLLARALKARLRFEGLVDRIDPRLRNPRLIAALRPLAAPLAAWVMLLLAGFLGGAFGLRTGLLHVVINLVLAWIVIRAATALVRDPALSQAIAVVVWVIAALNILGLMEAVTTALDGLALTVGSLRLSALTVIKAVLLLAILLWAASAASRLLQLRISTVQSLTPSVRVLIGNLLRTVLVLLAVVVALNTVGIDLTALALFSGAVGVGIGLGLQKVVANFVSGIVLLVEQSIKPGDVIELESQAFGWVTSMSARYVSVRGRDGKEHLIPNEDLITQRVVNWSYSSRLVRLDLPFGVAYGSDLRRVRALAVEAAALPERVVKVPPPVCHATGFAESTITFLLRFWIEDPENGVVNIRGEVLLALHDALVAAGIELPLPQRELRLRQSGAGDLLQQAEELPLARRADRPVHR